MGHYLDDNKTVFYLYLAHPVVYDLKQLLSSNSITKQFNSLQEQKEKVIFRNIIYVVMIIIIFGLINIIRMNL